MVPAAPIAVRLPVVAGNVIHARVIAQSRSVTVQLTNSSTGRAFLKTVQPRVLDTTSADYIVEAPGDCPLVTDCSDLSLADFGTVTMFSGSAEATSGASGAISSPPWDATASDLIPSTPSTAHPASAASFTAGAVTTQPAQHGSAFSVIYTPLGPPARCAADVSRDGRSVLPRRHPLASPGVLAFTGLAGRFRGACTVGDRVRPPRDLPGCVDADRVRKSWRRSPGRCR
jgi:hypothetical protein